MTGADNPGTPAETSAGDTPGQDPAFGRSEAFSDSPSAIRRYRVAGLHCPACERLVAGALAELPGVRELRINRSRTEVELELSREPDQAWHDAAARDLAALGYGWRQRTAWPWAGLGLGGLSLGILLAALNWAEQVGFSVSGAGPWSGVLLGLIASVSSCFALVGALVLGLGAEWSGERPRRQVQGHLGFHLARLGVFAALGALLAGTGARLPGQPLLGWVLQGLPALFLVWLGWAQAGLPPLVPSRRFRAVALRGALPRGRKLPPLAAGSLSGALTLFLPCGFTQMALFQALAAPDALTGLQILGGFALGTLPVLGGLSLAGPWFKSMRLPAPVRQGLGVILLGLGIYQVWLLARLAGILAMQFPS